MRPPVQSGRHPLHLPRPAGRTVRKRGHQKPAAGISAKEYLAFVLDNPAVTVRN